MLQTFDLGFSVKKTPDQKVKCTELIDISDISELTEVKVTNEGVTLGGALSLSKVMTVLEDEIAKGNGNVYFEFFSGTFIARQFE